MNILHLSDCLKSVEELRVMIGKVGVWVEGDIYYGDFPNGKRNGLGLEILSSG